MMADRRAFPAGIMVDKRSAHKYAPEKSRGWRDDLSWYCHSYTCAYPSQPECYIECVIYLIFSKADL